MGNWSKERLHGLSYVT